MTRGHSKRTPSSGGPGNPRSSRGVRTDATSKLNPSTEGPGNGPEDIESPTAVGEVTSVVADVSVPAPSPGQYSSSSTITFQPFAPITTGVRTSVRDGTLEPVLVSGYSNGTAQEYTLNTSTGQYTASLPLDPFPGLGTDVRTAIGDVNGDGIPDYIFATGPGTPFEVTVISGTPGNPVLVAPFDPFLPAPPLLQSDVFTAGEFVSAGDFLGNGRHQIVVSPDQSGGPRVAIYDMNGTAAATIQPYTAVEVNTQGINLDPGLTRITNFLSVNADFRGGARTAVGDLNGDGVPDLVAPGFGGGPAVLIINGTRVPTTDRFTASADLIGDFFAFKPNLRDGVHLAITNVLGNRGHGIWVREGRPVGPNFEIVLESDEETRTLSDVKSLPQARIVGLVYQSGPPVFEMIGIPATPSVMFASPIFHLAPLVSEKIDIRLIDLVRIGRSTYRLQKPATGKFTPGAEQNPGRFEVEGFENLVVGQGLTEEASRADWENRLHAKFQKLYPLQDDEMSMSQRQAWEKLTRLVDVEAYRKTVSVVGREIGQVVASGRLGKVILWQGGRRDTVRFARAPGELVLVKKGEWLQAMVARHPDTYQIRRILWLKPYTPRSGKLDDAHQAKVERIPTIATLPETTWD